MAGVLTSTAHIRVKARNSDGHVCGELHHRAKWPDAIVAMARDISEAQEPRLGARRTCWELRRQLLAMGYSGPLPGLPAVKTWIEFNRRALLRPNSTLGAYDLRGYAIPCVGVGYGTS
jgi:hypothetical protein